MKLLVAAPCYGGVASEPFVQSLLRLVFAAPSLGLDVSVLTTAGESLVTRARNNIVGDFLAGDWDALLFVDADIEFQVENVVRLVESGYPLCATPYPLKRIDWDAAVAAGAAGGDAEMGAYQTVVNQMGEVSEGGFAPVLDAGTGFMLIHRSVLETMIAVLPHTKYESDSAGVVGVRHALFDTAIEDNRYLSEDYLFCRRWQRLGGQVMVDVGGPGLKHHGAHTFGR